MKEWYLMTSDTHPNSLGGFENEAFCDFRNDAFDEALDTELASDVILYNADLSESKHVKCIVQDNMSDTQLNSMNRGALFQIGTVKAGMYVYYNDIYWLIVGNPGNNHFCEKVIMAICQYKIKWQDETGRIIERWCNAVTASKYNMGESINQTLSLPSNDFTIMIPSDDDGLTLDGKRVFIDIREENPTKVFRATRDDDILYHYGSDAHGGVLSFIIDKSLYNPDTDNQEEGICDYISPVRQRHHDNNWGLHAIIKGGYTLRNGVAKAWNVEFRNRMNELIHDIDFTWNIIADFDIEQTVDDETITLKVDDESLIEQSFKLQVMVYDDEYDENVILSEINIVIIGLI